MDFKLVVPSKMPRIDKIIPEKCRIPLEQMDQNVRNAQMSAFAEGTLSNLTTQWVKISYILFNL